MADADMDIVVVPPDVELRFRHVIAARRFEIPPFPAVVNRLHGMLAEDRCSAADLAALVTADQALAAAVLRQASSVAMGLKAPCSLEAAVIRLGAFELLKLALAVSLGASVTKSGPLFAVRKQVWQRSVATAYVAQALAPRCAAAPDTAFVCGLLRDVGRLIAIGALEGALQAAERPRALEVWQWEEVIGAYSLELTAAAIDAWALPSPLPETVGGRGTAPEHRRLIDLVDGAAHLVRRMLAGSPVEPPDVARLAVVGALPHAEVVRALASVPEPVCALLDIAPGPVPPRADPWVRPPAPAPLREKQSSITLTTTTGGASATYRVVAFKLAVVGVRGKVSLPASFLTKARIEGGGAPLEAFVVAKSCARVGDELLLQLAPFALSREQETAWRELCRIFEV